MKPRCPALFFLNDSTEVAMKFVVAAMTAVMLAGAVWAQPAQARCWSNGYAVQCWHHYPHPYWHRHAWRERHWHHYW